MILKSYIVEKNINLINDYFSILFYGENDGIKDDIKNQIKKINKDSEIINLFQEDIIKNESIIFKEINNLSLFSNNKIIFIHEASDKIHKIILECLDKRNKQATIYIFSKLLDKKSKLRAHYEKNKSLGIIPCYQDNDRTLTYYVMNELKNYNGVSPEIVNLIINNSSSDRKLISAELIKIKNFYLDKKIKRESLISLLNIKFDDNFNKIRDASLMGNKEKVNSLIGEIDFIPENTFFFLYSIGNRISKLLEIQEIVRSTKDKELAIETLNPKIFWKDKPIYIEQLNKWNITKLENALNAIGDAELLIKNNSSIRKDVIVKKLLITLCKSASSS